MTLSSAMLRNRSLVRIFRAVFIGYILVLIVMWSLQRALLYHPRTGVPLELEEHPRTAELYPCSLSVKIKTQDNEQIGAWLLTHQPRSGLNPAIDNSMRHRLVLFLHGNGGDRAQRLGWYEMFHRLGADVLAIDYRGYGDSTGTPSESGLIIDAQSAWRYATQELGYLPQDIVIFGVSLGGGVAVQLASHVSTSGEQPGGLVIVASFSSVVDVAAGRYPFLPVRWILSDHFDSASCINNVLCPIVQFHGDQDTVVPYEYGKKLFTTIQPSTVPNFPQPEFITLNGVGHNDLIRSAGPQIETEFAAFLRRIDAGRE